MPISPWKLNKPLITSRHLTVPFLLTATDTICLSEIYAPNATFNSENTIATFAIYGCQPKKILTIVRTADFAVLVDETIFVTVMIAACASTLSYLAIIIARQANTCPTVLSAKRTCSPHDPHLTKCHVDMPFIGIAFES
jgi:hypothetical protein